jgi:hypothetical protein
MAAIESATPNFLRAPSFSGRMDDRDAAVSGEISIDRRSLQGESLMNYTRVTQGMLSGLLLTAALLADEPAPGVATSAESPPPVAGAASSTIRLHLMEGSVVTGRLSIAAMTVETPYGKLEVPVNQIVSITPGLDSHPEERKRIGRLILQLGSNSAAERDAAQRTLTEMGHLIQPELARYASDEDAERRTRIQKILAELEEVDIDDDADSMAPRPWISQDTVETTMFTVVGRITPQTFQVQTQFGPLNVSINDIRRGERESEQKPEIRKSLAINGGHLVQLNMVSAGIRLNRGDKVNVTADGKLVMSPWGNNATSSPDGSEQFQWYIPNQIAGGTLVGRIGSSGKVFKIGSKSTFTAPRAGALYLGIAMNPQFASQDYSYPGEYNVKIRVNPR